MLGRWYLLFGQESGHLTTFFDDRHEMTLESFGIVLHTWPVNKQSDDENTYNPFLFSGFLRPHIWSDV